ncbi:proteoglycan 4 [Ischnura elegans]|uniref:proteoglycan 4 n=1 Tax=Ischnura elegans TaxID=197161 RepID=UPI001ED8AFFC|nr:proteoglycan 4 [Ischnura elegans]
MSSRSQQAEDSLDSAIPPWKRELILRRRALLARTHGGIPTPGSGGALNSAAASLLVAGHSGAVKTAAAAFSAISEEKRATGVKCQAAMKLEGLECEDASRMNGKMPTASALADPASSKGRGGARLPPPGVGRAGPRRRSSKGPADVEDDEELRYGPGIVNRLRSKYLSMTLRESQTRGLRPSLSSLRRAASMEDILDGPPQAPAMQQQQGKDLRGDGKATIQTQKVGRYVKRSVRAPLNLQPQQAPEALKRARSVEALLRCEPKSPVGLLSPTLAKEDVIIIEGTKQEEQKQEEEAVEGRRSRKPSGLAEEELPPPDVVRQTLKIFEYSSPPTSPGATTKKSTVSPAAPTVPRPPSSNGVAPGGGSVVVRATPAVAIPQSPPPPLGPKPQLSPKPLILQMSGPSTPRPTPSNKEPDAGGSPKKAPKPMVAAKEARPSVLPIAPKTTPTSNRTGVTTPTKKASSPTKTVKTSPTGGKRPSPTTDVPNGGLEGRTVSRSALENIRKDGLSIEFKFDGGGAQKPKAHLPNAAGPPKQVGVIRPMAKPPTPPGAAATAAVRRPTPPRTIAPLQSPTAPPDVVKSTLTETEKEKNHINRVKSTEVRAAASGSSSVVGGPVVAKLVSPPAAAGATKLVTVVKEVPSVSRVEPVVQLKKVAEEEKAGAGAKTGLWDSRSRWNEQQNSVIFNFVARSEVPDYIENDGLIIRPRDRPRRNEPGSIWLRDATRGESADDEGEDDEDDDEDVADAYGWVSSDPPPPCNVRFEGDNVLINGRSNLRKNSALPSPNPGTRKPRITFNDEATKTFEYPSESSFMDESPPPVPQASAVSTSPSVHTPPPTSMAPPSIATTGGSLSSYTPSKIQIGADFQLGITRTIPQPSSSSNVSPSPSKESKQAEDEEEYLKPTEEGVTWSAETAADLLF